MAASNQLRTPVSEFSFALVQQKKDKTFSDVWRLKERIGRGLKRIRRIFADANREFFKTGNSKKTVIGF